MGLSARPLLCVIPARGGSKGLPGKNIRLLAGLPLIVHSIRCSKMCPQIARTIVSTDSEEIAVVAGKNGAEVPFMRPPELAQDQTPMLPVLQHALRTVEESEGRSYAALLLMDPTSPGRFPSDVAEAIQMMEEDPDADGVVGVSQPEFNPYWHSVIEREGYMAPLIPGAEKYSRRQDVPKAYRINATLYLFRRDYLLAASESWMRGKLRLLEIPESRAIHIDDIDEFERADLMIKHGLIKFPWMQPR